ncbi:hypothetical protein ElyMa_004179200 [Elysia marginata]|uniref:Uncharacterized protein n=1 Tax=Elysia marginata TaxID=1093978 RepID=A0AAV4GK38_9GAST|nr:hypothetical protein ElyMa_004179200 [Elysia marginata]
MGPSQYCSDGSKTSSGGSGKTVIHIAMIFIQNPQLVSPDQVPIFRLRSGHSHLNPRLPRAQVVSVRQIQQATQLLNVIIHDCGYLN